MKALISVLLLSCALAQLPVLIVPGTGGNRMEAKLDKNEGEFFFIGFPSILGNNTNQL